MGFRELLLTSTAMKRQGSRETVLAFGQPVGSQHGTCYIYALTNVEQWLNCTNVNESLIQADYKEHRSRSTCAVPQILILANLVQCR